MWAVLPAHPSTHHSPYPLLFLPSPPPFPPLPHFHIFIVFAALFLPAPRLPWTSRNARENLRKYALNVIGMSMSRPSFLSSHPSPFPLRPSPFPLTPYPLPLPFVRELHAALEQRTNQLAAATSALQRLRDDFEYNLQVIAARDAELTSLESQVSTLRAQVRRQ